MKDSNLLQTSPLDVSALLLLSFLSEHHYLCILYDPAGRPHFIFNKPAFKFPALAELLAIYPIHFNYHVPAEKNLNALFSGTSGNRGQGPAESSGIEGQIKKALGPVYIRRFPSRNILEAKSEISKLTLSYPLSDMHLVRLSKSHFLGILGLSEIYMRMAAFEENMMVLTDTQEQVMGYTDAFHNLLGAKNKRELLGRPLSEIIRFEQNKAQKSEPSSAAKPYKTICRWQAGRPLAPDFKICQKQPTALFTKTEDGLLWDNTDGAGYSYLPFKRPLNVDNSHVKLEIVFANKDDSIPNVLLRGRKINLLSPQALETMDFFGYNLSAVSYNLSEAGKPPRKSYVLKKGGTPVFSASMEDISEGREERLELEKEGTRFIFKLDGRVVMDWTDYSPFQEDSDHVFTLFVRPGHKVLLKSIHLQTAPDTTEASRKRWPRRNAEICFAKTRFFFSVKQTPQFWDGRTLNLLILDDVSDYRDSIQSLEKEKSRLESILKQEHSLTGCSPSIMEIRKTVDIIADSNLTVLLEGETGTGKEVLARAIHNAGARREKPFVRIDCAMLPESLMEAELFGYEKGAFTGAAAAHAGRFEQGQGGVVFLDEISNLSRSVQAKLLGVLQDFHVQRIGGNRSIPLDIRLIVATNVPLRQLIDQGRFREDLFYRLNQMRFALPPLRERREDIPMLAEQFIREANRLYAKSVEGLSDEALDKISHADWPGNVRELRSAILRAVLFSAGKEIQPAHIEIESARESTSPSRGKQKERKKRKRLLISQDEFEKLLIKEKGNLARISQVLEVSRPSIYRMFGKCRMRPADFRAGAVPPKAK